MKVWVVIRHYEFDAVFLTKEAAERYVAEMESNPGTLYGGFRICEEEVRE